MTPEQTDWFWPAKRVAHVCAQIANGMAYLHFFNVLHCDIKSSNLLRTSGGEK